jgi:hypothetical protein
MHIVTVQGVCIVVQSTPTPSMRQQRLHVFMRQAQRAPYDELVRPSAVDVKPRSLTTQHNSNSHRSNGHLVDLKMPPAVGPAQRKYLYVPRREIVS